MWEEIINSALGSVSWFNFPAALFIIGLCQILKMWGVESKVIPLFAIGFGVAGGVASTLMGDNPLAQNAAGGLFVALAAMGLFSGVKSVWEHFQPK